MGHPYGPLLVPAPLRDDQRQQIRLLGYDLPGHPAAAAP